MAKKFKYLFTFLLLFVSSNGKALSLGEIHIHSSLNQSLHATVDINKAENVHSEEIIAKVADKKHFKQSSINYQHFFNQLKMDVRKVREDKAEITIRSHDPVIEPFLNFIIEVITPSGKTYRQYTLLIEPDIKN